MLFLDGVGIGTDNASVNPLVVAELPALRALLGGFPPVDGHRTYHDIRASLLPLDANLGVDGLPQSGTGQTALFTGENGPAIAGRHFGPYPYSTLKPIIAEKNIFRRLQEAGASVCFANAFPDRFFAWAARQRSRLTVTTLSCMTSGIPLAREQDLLGGRAVSADITGAGWHALGHPAVPVISPQEAGRRLAALVSEHDFVLFEYWHTDHAGHHRNMEEAVDVLQRFDGMLEGILSSLTMDDTLLFVTSDHGNIEDLSVKSHTRNPVPGILAGAGHGVLAEKLRATPSGGDLTQVTPLLVDHIVHHQ